MRARWLLCLAAALALPAASAAAQSTPPAQTQAQALFEDLIVKDARTTAGVRQLLQSDAGFVGAQPVFSDLTGDGRMDAVVQVRMPGAAGTVAVFVFSSDGTRANRLRAVFRSQALYRATARVDGGPTLTVVQPDWAKGDRLCCTTDTAERHYAWNARTHTLTRR
ncbi:MAG: hypothetical protein ACJ76M_07205 [Solirubrobacteraceae bacterium]|jgi:hypothetical protein